jgi:hypothetical protein
MSATSLVYPVFFNLLTLYEELKLWGSSLYNLLRTPIT